MIVLTRINSWEILTVVFPKEAKGADWSANSTKALSKLDGTLLQSPLLAWRQTSEPTFTEKSHAYNEACLIYVFELII